MDTPYLPTPSTFVGGLFLDPILPSSFLHCISSDSPSHSNSSPTTFNFSDSVALFPHAKVSLQTNGFRSSFLSITLKRDTIVPDSPDPEVSGNGDKTPPGSAVSRPRRKAAMNSTKHLWAGAVAAMVSRTVLAPLERLKLEYIVRGEKRQMFEVIRAIATTQGLGGFWKGNLLNILRTAPFKAINFCASDMYSKQLKKIQVKEEMQHLERFIAGAAAGITATVLCLPLDTVNLGCTETPFLASLTCRKLGSGEAARKRSRNAGKRSRNAASSETFRKRHVTVSGGGMRRWRRRLFWWPPWEKTRCDRSRFINNLIHMKLTEGGVERRRSRWRDGDGGDGCGRRAPSVSAAPTLFFGSDSKVTRGAQGGRDGVGGGTRSGGRRCRLRFCSGGIDWGKAIEGGGDRRRRPRREEEMRRRRRCTTER